MAKKEVWEINLELYLTNTLWINKKTADDIIEYLKQNYSIVPTPKP